MTARGRAAALGWLAVLAASCGAPPESTQEREPAEQRELELPASIGEYVASEDVAPDPRPLHLTGVVPPVVYGGQCVRLVGPGLRGRNEWGSSQAFRLGDVDLHVRSFDGPLVRIPPLLPAGRHALTLTVQGAPAGRVDVDVLSDEQALSYLRNLVGPPRDGGPDVVDWLAARSRSIPLSHLLPEETFLALVDPATPRDFSVDTNALPPNLREAAARTLAASPGRAVETLVAAVCSGERGGAPWQRGFGVFDLEGVAARKGLEPVTATLLERLFTVEAEVWSVAPNGRERLAVRSGCALGVDRRLVTARRLIRPHEYEPELAATVAEHQTRGRQVEVQARFTGVEDGSLVFQWPAPAGLGPVRGLDPGPERCAAGRESVMVRGNEVMVLTSRTDVTTFRLRGFAPWSPYFSANTSLSAQAGELGVAVGAARPDGGLPELWRVVGRWGGGPRLTWGDDGELGARSLGAPAAILGWWGEGDVVGVVTGSERRSFDVGLILGEGEEDASVVDGPAISGTVVGSDGAPAGWVTVEAYAGSTAHPDLGLAREATDGQGAFRLALPAALDEVTLRVRHWSDGQVLLEGVSVAIPAGDALRLSLPGPAPQVPTLDEEEGREEAPPPWTGLRVVLFDEETQAPPPRAAVRARGPDGSSHAVPGVGGVFELRDLEPGEWTIEIDAGASRQGVEKVNVVADQVAYLRVAWEGVSTHVERTQVIPAPPAPETLGRTAADLPPSWVTLQGDVYFARTIDRAETARLQVEPRPRWFDLPWGPPRRIDDLPLEEDGVRLDLEARPGAAEELLLTVTLRAGPHGVVREVEHRNTNLVPLLFALEADGASVVVEPPDAWGTFGGVNGFIELAPPGGVRTWSLRIASASVDRVVPRPLPEELAVTAAFCEVQHGVSFPSDDDRREPLPPLVDLGLAVRKPILVRSERVVLKRVEGRWVPDE